jgi:dTDP-glucose 4,6-dehydratase
MNSKNVLLTGCAGCIGSCIINTLTILYPNTKFINLDVLTYAANPKNINNVPNYQFVKGNICDADMVSYVFDTYRPNIILHLAAESHVDNSFGNSLKFTHTNVIGTHTLLECARQYRDNGGELELFLHFSTDEVFGSADGDKPCDENSLLLPSNPYAASKAAAEMICQAYIKSFKLPIIIVRCNNAVSPYQFPEKLIPKTIQRILNDEKIPVHGDGSSLRTFIDAEDIAYALDVIISKGTIGQIYNIGSDQEYTVLNVIKIILNILKPEEKIENCIEFVEDRAFQDKRYWIDDRILRDLGWTPKINFLDSIHRVISHIKKNL